MRSRQKRSYFSAKSSKILGVLCALCGEKVFLQWSHRYKNLKDAFIKRFSWLSHLVLGFTDGLAPAGAWAAIRGSLFQASDAPAWVLTFIITFWIGGFDLIYACQDYESDRAIGLHSFPARFGIPAALTGARWAHIAAVGGLIGLGLLTGLNWPYWVGVVISTGLLIYEHAIIAPDDFSRLGIAFFNVNGYISLVLFFATLLSL